MGRKVITVALPEEIWEKLQDNARAYAELPSEAARRLLRESLIVAPAPAPGKAQGKPHPGKFIFEFRNGKHVCLGCGAEFDDDKPGLDQMEAHFRQHFAGYKTGDALMEAKPVMEMEAEPFIEAEAVEE